MAFQALMHDKYDDAALRSSGSRELASVSVVAARNEAGKMVLSDF